MVKIDRNFEKAANDRNCRICPAAELFLPKKGEPVLSVLPYPELRGVSSDEKGFRRAAELSASVMSSLGFDTGPEFFDLTEFESSNESEPLFLEGLSAVDCDIPYAEMKINGKTVSYASVNDLQEEESKLEIYVETAEKHRSYGYGTACVCSLRNLIVQKGFAVRYVTDTDNVPSLRVAEKAGFTKIGRRLIAVFYKMGGE